MPVFLFDITSSGVHHRICGTSVGHASLDICNLPPLPQLGERHECTVIFYRLLKIIFQYRNSDIQLDMLQQFENFWLFLLLYQRLCGGIVFVATPVTQDNTATALCILTAYINRSDGEMMLQRRTKRPMWRGCVASIKPALRMFVPCFFLTCHVQRLCMSSICKLWSPKFAFVTKLCLHQHQMRNKHLEKALRPN